MEILEPVLLANLAESRVNKIKPSRVLLLASLSKHIKVTETDFEKRIINQVKYN